MTEYTFATDESHIIFYCVLIKNLFEDEFSYSITREKACFCLVSIGTKFSVKMVVFSGKWVFFIRFFTKFCIKNRSCVLYEAIWSCLL
ncbi:MAG: hypothetical protein D6706_09215 [Chloroflexi bacterium]|nr:MAG: hypothetical protein D6706_09215 [Chloroflexota bacterium]